MSEPPEVHDPTGLGLARATGRAIGRQVRRRSTGRGREPRPVVEPRLSGARPDDRDPAPLGAALEHLVEAKGWSTDVTVHSVLARWPALVGPEVAQHARPEAYADTVLTVRTDSSAWAVQLRHMAPQIVAILTDKLGHQTVTRVEVLGPAAPSWKRGPRSVRDGRGPRDTYG